MTILLPDKLIIDYLKKAKVDFEQNGENSHYMHMPKNLVKCLNDDSQFGQFLIAAAILNWPALVKAIKKQSLQKGISEADLKNCLVFAQKNASYALSQLLEQ